MSFDAGAAASPVSEPRSSRRGSLRLSPQGEKSQPDRSRAGLRHASGDRCVIAGYSAVQVAADHLHAAHVRATPRARRARRRISRARLVLAGLVADRAVDFNRVPDVLAELRARLAPRSSARLRRWPALPASPQPDVPTRLVLVSTSDPTEGSCRVPSPAFRHPVTVDGLRGILRLLHRRRARRGCGGLTAAAWSGRRARRQSRGHESSCDHPLHWISSLDLVLAVDCRIWRVCIVGRRSLSSSLAACDPRFHPERCRSRPPRAPEPRNRRKFRQNAACATRAQALQTHSRSSCVRIRIAEVYAPPDGSGGPAGTCDSVWATIVFQRESGGTGRRAGLRIR